MTAVAGLRDVGFLVGIGRSRGRQYGIRLLYFLGQRFVTEILAAFAAVPILNIPRLICSRRFGFHMTDLVTCGYSFGKCICRF